jgi:hypothetical protein
MRMPRTRGSYSVLSPEILHAALAGLDAQRNRIEADISRVRALLGIRRPGRPARTAAESSPSEAEQPKTRKKRTMSAAARKRIAAAQKKRWAEYHKHTGKE